MIDTGLYEKGRYLLYSLPDQSARYSLSYPDHPVYPGLQEKTKAMLYASNVLRVRPDGEAFVCADMYSGVIDFCRVTAILSSGYDWFDYITRKSRYRKSLLHE